MALRCQTPIFVTRPLCRRARPPGAPGAPGVALARAVRRPRVLGRRHLERDRPRRGARLHRRPGLHAEPPHVEADRARRRAGGAVSRPPGGGGDRVRRLPRALPRQPRKPRSRDPRQVGGGDARVPRDRGGDRRRGGGLPRRLAPRRRSRGGPCARRARASRAARADRRPALARAGELRRRRRNDRALGRRARQRSSSSWTATRASGSASTPATGGSPGST